jgi:hypothetical protein
MDYQPATSFAARCRADTSARYAASARRPASSARSASMRGAAASRRARTPRHRPACRRRGLRRDAATKLGLQPGCQGGLVCAVRPACRRDMARPPLDPFRIPLTELEDAPPEHPEARRGRPRVPSGAHPARPDEQRRLQSRCALSAASHGRADHRRDQAHPKRCRHTVGGAPESWVAERKERPSWSPLSRSRARPSRRCP